MSSLGGALAEEQNTSLRPFLQQKIFHELASSRTRLKRVLSEPSGSTSQRSDATLPGFNQPVLPITPGTETHKVSSQATTSTASESTNPSTDLRNFCTGRLKPQTHKLSRGQLVILPSKALLVDFRESERRKGQEGKQVLMITPDGNIVRQCVCGTTQLPYTDSISWQVEVYDAPHLSTPCCLAEPVAVYASIQLPTKYVKQYEDAIQIVDQLNARIPKVSRFFPSRMSGVLTLPAAT